MGGVDELGAGRGQRRLARDLEGRGPLHLVVVRELVPEVGDERRELPGDLVGLAGTDHDLVIAERVLLEVVVQETVAGARSRRRVVEGDLHLAGVLETLHELHVLVGGVVGRDVEGFPRTRGTRDVGHVGDGDEGAGARAVALELGTEGIVTCHGHPSLWVVRGPDVHSVDSMTYRTVTLRYLTGLLVADHPHPVPDDERVQVLVPVVEKRDDAGTDDVLGPNVALPDVTLREGVDRGSDQPARIVVSNRRNAGNFGDDHDRVVRRGQLRHFV